VQAGTGARFGICVAESGRLNRMILQNAVQTEFKRVEFAVFLNKSAKYGLGILKAKSRRPSQKEQPTTTSGWNYEKI
jgi:hypothetical protein